jgi:hypothetical protein
MKSKSHYDCPATLFQVVYDRNHYFGLGRIPKPKLADTYGRYRNRYRNYIFKGESESSYR